MSDRDGTDYDGSALVALALGRYGWDDPEQDLEEEDESDWADEDE